MNFAQLGLFLMPSDWQERILSIMSDREADVASHHFLVKATPDATVAKVGHKSNILVYDEARSDEVADQIVARFKEDMQRRAGDCISALSVHDHYGRLVPSMREAASRSL